MSHQTDHLKQKAIEFESLLTTYAQSDDDVQDFLNRMQPWFLKIKREEINLPCYEWQLSNYFSNPDLSPLAERYMGTDLGRMCSAFTLAMRCMESSN